MGLLRGPWRAGWIPNLIPSMRYSSVDEVDPRLMRNDAGVITALKQQLDRLASVHALVQRAVIHIHADELVGQCWIQVARELHGILQRRFAMVERVLNAV